MTAVIVIVAAVTGPAALFVVWNWAVDRVVDRQGRRFEEALRRERW